MSGTYSGSDKRLAHLFENGGGGGSTTVIANPSGEATDDLEKLQVGETIYDIPAGGSSTLAGLGDVNLSSLTDGQVLKYDETNDEWVNGAGGSGGGELYLNTIYSETEEKVGYWIDGKPLYQKTVHYNNPIPANSNNFQIPCGITTVDNVVSINVVAVDSSGLMVQLPLHIYTSHYQGPTYSVNVQQFDKTTGNLRIDTGEDVGYVGAYVTLQYTKTTDTPEVPQRGNIIYLPTIYSEEEREVGIWTDGKPLYQKTCIFTGSFNQNMVVGNINVSDVDKIPVIKGATFSGASDIIKPLTFAHSNANNNYSYFIRPNGDVEFRCGSAVTSTDTITCIYLIIEYTKTTDTAGSGSWTPSGASAVHYSTDEQVVGTWIDGKTLYEKTLEITNIQNRSLVNFAHGITNIDGIYSITGVCHAKLSIDPTNAYTPLPRIQDNSTSANLGVDVNSTNIVLKGRQTDFSEIYDKVYVTLRYTKSS